jgi:hypothetical protein
LTGIASEAISNVNGDYPAVRDPFGTSAEGLPSEGKERLAMGIVLSLCCFFIVVQDENTIENSSSDVVC